VTRATAGDRVRRLLAMVPWVNAHSPVAVDEVCERFGVTRAQLLADLEVLSFVGVPPYSPDTMIDVDIDDDLLSLRLSEPFDRPFRLTPDQALTLVAAGRGVRQVPGSDGDDPLQRALAKLAAALGVDPEQISVELGDSHEGALGVLTAAIADGVRVEIDYYTASRDERSVRAVDPYRVVSDRGNWYLVGWCRRSDDVRVFRVDRIAGIRRTDEPADPPPDGAEWAPYEPRSDDPRVTLELAPSARWIVDQYPCDAVDDLGEGRLRVTLGVSATRWLEGLLVSLGDAATVVDGLPELRQAGRSAAARILARYRDADPATVAGTLSSS
jgi:proteasome accessory factor C